MNRFVKSIAYSPRTIHLVERLEEHVPFLRQWHRVQYQRHFEKISEWERIFSGVFPNFASAQSGIPKGHFVGYDNPKAAVFLGSKSSLLPSEYPTLFWLSLLFRHNATIFDFGGYLAILYNTYKQFGIYPAALQWTVYDVPAVVAAGKQLLQADPDPHLCYTSSKQDAALSNILLASGSLQYCEETITELLTPLSRLPDHLLINKLPTTEHDPFFTLQNMGPAISPYRIVNRNDFIRSLEDLGYRLIDSWKNPDLSCYVPFHPDQAVSAFDGFYFNREMDKVGGPRASTLSAD